MSNNQTTQEAVEEFQKAVNQLRNLFIQKSTSIFIFIFRMICKHKWGGYNNKICQKCGKCRGVPMFKNCPPPPPKKLF
jgi:hypothetical protein